MKNFAHLKNKFGYIFVFTSNGFAEKILITQHFLQRKMNEYEQLKVEIEALRSQVSQSQINGLRKVNIWRLP